MIRLILIVTAFVAVSSAHAFDAKQIAQAEAVAEECRQKYMADGRAAEFLRQRRCALLEELAREKRKAYEDRKRKER